MTTKNKISEGPIIYLELVTNRQAITKLLEECERVGVKISKEMKSGATKISEGIMPDGVTDEMIRQAENMVMRDLCGFLNKHGNPQGYQFVNFFNGLGWMKL